MKLTNFEKETIIRFNEAEKMAVVETCSKKWKKRLRENAEESDEVQLIREDEYSVTYRCPKNLLFMRKLIRLSEKRKADLRAQAARIRGMKKLAKEKEKNFEHFM